MRSLNRRSLLTGAAALAAMAALDAPARATNTAGIRVGAIRWDAWYGGAVGGNAWSAAHNLDPAQYQYRAPFFAKQISPNLMSIVGTQASMDAEITYAKNAGLKYWAFCNYTPGTDLRNGWTLYQSSALKANVNWCWIYEGAQLASDVGTSSTLNALVAQLGQSNHETVLNGRPLIYLLNSAGIANSSIASAVTTLRNACTSAGLKSPFVVAMAGSASNAQTAYSGYGADGISNYGVLGSTTSYGTYASLRSQNTSFWASMAGANLPYIPCGTTGSDQRPRFERPLPAGPRLPFQGLSNSYAVAQPSEIAAHAQELLTFVSNNTSVCTTGDALLYSWDECDEGGGALCPTWTASGPNTAYLTALTGVI